MYRASEEALRARLENSERALRHQLHRADSAEEALSDATTRLGRLRDGVTEADDLDEKGFSPIVRGSLHTIGLLGILSALAAAFTFAATYFPAPYASWVGLRNAVWIVRHREGLTGLAGAAAIFALASPWAMLPFAGAVGIATRRRWGWLVAVVAAVLWLPTPVAPLSLIVLSRLFNVRTRSVFFGA